MKSYVQVAGEAVEYAARRFDADEQDTTWLIHDAFCDDPSCKGGEVLVTLVDAADTQRRVKFNMNLSEWTVSHTGLSALDRAIVNELAEDRSTWRLLERHRQVVRAWGLARCADAPRVTREDRLYTFADFDLHDDQFAVSFESDGREWVALDQHCVNPSCACDDVVLSFFHAGTGERPRHQETFSARISIGTGEATQGKTGAPLRPDERRTLRDYQRELGEWQKDLSLRRRLLREIAAKRLKRAPAPTASLPDKVGRNDPCPCGSGRKAKKCCGA